MTDRLDVLEQVVTCTACGLHAQCSGPVAFRGPTTSSIVVVGEAPGAQEDEQGLPFVGPSGAKLTEMLDDVGLAPETLGFVNTVSCFPHGTPEWDHVNACAPNKTAQIEMLDPTWVLLVGRVALKGTRPDLDVKHGRGRPFVHNGRVHFATYHPAAALRNSNYEEAMADDLAVFAEMADGFPGDWSRHIPDQCSACLNLADWWEDPAGLGWCENHAGPERRTHFADIFEERPAESDEDGVKRFLGIDPGRTDVIVCTR